MILGEGNLSRKDEMSDFGEVVLITFVIIRILLTAGALYLAISEILKYRKHRREKPGKLT